MSASRPRNAAAVAVAALALAAVLLAGCSGGPSGSTSGTSRTQQCPAWQVGLSSAVVESRYDSRFPENPTNDTFPVASNALVDNGHALDRIYIYLQPTGTDQAGANRGVLSSDMKVTLSFYRADTHEPLRAYDMAKGAPGANNVGSYHWTFGPSPTTPEQKLLLVRLTQPPTMPDPANPTGILVEYTYEANLDGNNDTPSTATVSYVAKFEYRLC